jgi:UDP-N-acetylmuramate--alanine ligase
MEISSILNNKKHIHFIGIGGSGMYPLAQILHAKGYYLTGSDNNETETLDAVRKMGIPVNFGQRAENIEGADLIVHTAAIMSDNPELIAAKESGVPVLERSELLGLVTTWYDNAVCISGTHGKTTTTSMLTQILIEEGVDLSAVIGGKLSSIGGSGRAGSSDIMVCEACEFVDTFLKLSPDISIVLNIDEDHLDYFKTLDNIIMSFRKFCDKARKAVIINGDDFNSMRAIEGITGKDVITFGFKDTNDYYPVINKTAGMQTDFTLMHRDEKVCDLSVHVPGIHNVLNAVAAAAGALYLGVSTGGIMLGLQTFRGAGRRFEKIAEIGGITVVDDYAHHPAEIKVTLEAAKKLGFKRVWAVHQPFTYSRTRLLLEDFARVLQIADKTVLTEIMGSREKNTYNIYSRDLAEKIPGCVWFSTFEEVAEHVAGNAQPGDIVITLGCGDVYKAAKMIVRSINERNGG